jgi:hypothetical protein
VAARAGPSQAEEPCVEGVPVIPAHVAGTPVDPACPAPHQAGRLISSSALAPHKPADAGAEEAQPSVQESDAVGDCRSPSNDCGPSSSGPKDELQGHIGNATDDAFPDAPPRPPTSRTPSKPILLAPAGAGEAAGALPASPFPVGPPPTAAPTLATPPRSPGSFALTKPPATAAGPLLGAPDSPGEPDTDTMAVSPLAMRFASVPLLPGAPAVPGAAAAAALVGSGPRALSLRCWSAQCGTAHGEAGSPTGLQSVAGSGGGGPASGDAASSSRLQQPRPATPASPRAAAALAQRSAAAAAGAVAVIAAGRSGLVASPPPPEAPASPTCTVGGM